MEINNIQLAMYATHSPFLAGCIPYLQCEPLVVDSAGWPVSEWGSPYTVHAYILCVKKAAPMVDVTESEYVPLTYRSTSEVLPTPACSE